jgi:hypothetical protein
MVRRNATVHKIEASTRFVGSAKYWFTNRIADIL